MSDQQKGYTSRDHLVKIQTKQGLKDYLPAAWRLYELNLRYPNANFRSEILHFDVERNLAIVKCTLYLGSGDVEKAERKTEAMKQGLLSALDKVETAAKARCARDLGISTELALEISDDDLELEGAEVVQEDTHPPQAESAAQKSTPLAPAMRDRLNTLYARAKVVVPSCESVNDFKVYVARLLKLNRVEVSTLQTLDVAYIEADISKREAAAKEAA
jgi:hypothetical protein